MGKGRAINNYLLMEKNKRLSDLLFNKPTKVKIDYPKLNLKKPIPVGHLLAVNCYDEGVFKDVLFVDHIDVCKSHTVFYFSRDYFEWVWFWVARIEQNPYSTEVFYNNDTSIEIIKIS